MILVRFALILTEQAGYTLSLCNWKNPFYVNTSIKGNYRKFINVGLQQPEESQKKHKKLGTDLSFEGDIYHISLRLVMTSC